jgi:DNA polymerase-3 subunit gamma/tau
VANSQTEQRPEPVQTQPAAASQAQPQPASQPQPAQPQPAQPQPAQPQPAQPQPAQPQPAQPQPAQPQRAQAQPAQAQPSSPARSQLEQPSLYRRHRPRTFADVVGQEPVVRTLRHAVERGRVHHAYLFVGSRGTGKTSMAKILAACLNCERGPTIEPCGQCESCRAIAAASSLDVIEMDAASNNSVDDIRELREGVAFAPVSGRSKVYILDEAHMLSTAAWNAFLKTLEEPPPGTVFVLATTEAQKVPATVVDRCHRFDFQRPTVEQIAGVLRRTAQAESIAIPPEAVAAVARAATGSFRDALGTLEQLVTYSGREIALEDVLAVLGTTGAELLEETLDAVHAGDARAVLLAIARCAEGGRDAGSFAADLEVRARELLLVATLGEVPAELAQTADADARLAAQAARVGAGTAVRVLEQLGAALEAVKAGADPRTQLELALVKAARPEVDGSLRALLDRLERLERAAAVGAGGAGSGGGVGVGPPGAAPDTYVVESPGPAPSAAAPERPPVPEPVVPVAPAAVPQAPVEPAGTRVAQTSPQQAPPQVSAPPAPAAPATPDPIAQGAAPVAAPAEDIAAPTQDIAVPADDIDALVALWPAVLELVGAENKMLSSLLAQARPVAVGDGELRVAFGSTASFLKRKAEDGAHRATVTAALRELSGDRRLRVAYELREELPEAPAGGEAQAPRTEEEWVARFMDEFDAEELSAQERALANGAGAPAGEPSEPSPETETATGE